MPYMEHLGMLNYPIYSIDDFPAKKIQQLHLYGIPNAMVAPHCTRCSALA